MADSFAGVSTFVVIDPSQERTAPSGYSVRPIPGGNTWYLDVLGQAGIQVKLLLHFSNDADYQAFEALRNTIGTLVCFDINGQAFLADVHRTFRNPAGSAADAEATFLLM